MSNQSVIQSQTQGYQKQFFEIEPQPQKKIHYDDVYEFLQK